MKQEKVKTKPLFALTMGDPAGIGPEIILKALTDQTISSDYNLFVIGDTSVLEHARSFVPITSEIHSMSSIGDLRPNSINVYDMECIDPAHYHIGEINGKCGSASYAYIRQAIDFAKEKKIDGVITNPINKTSLKKAHIYFPGHTEIFAQETGTIDYAMVLGLDGIFVAHVTTHCSLKQALEKISTGAVYATIMLLFHTLKDFGIDEPRLAVGGLNPHAGESRIFGEEEHHTIIPAIQKAQSSGVNVQGPFPPDTVFHRAFEKEFDGVVAMLHDHGFTALKSRDFEQCVNITIGLPIIRTSVGHGTAFDIAGTGRASEKNLLAAIKTAHQIYSWHR